MPGHAVKRLVGIKDPIRSNDAGAAKMTFVFSDGSSEEVEIARADFRPTLETIMAVCAALGEAVPETRPLAETTPAQAVLVPTEDFSTKRMPGGGLWLMFRVGSQDISVALPDPRSAELLADALLHPKD